MKESKSKIAVLLQDGHSADHFLSAVKEEPNFFTTLYTSLEKLAQASVLPDAVVICPRNFEMLRSDEPMLYLRLSRRSRLILFLQSQALLDYASLLAYADAWVFEDIPYDRLTSLIALGLEGHSLIPLQFLSRVGVDTVRGKFLSRLSGMEFQVLVLLGGGLNNRTVAARVGLSETMVKSLVRSVLAKLHFRNRTEAGVFAARQQELLENIRL